MSCKLRHLLALSLTATLSAGLFVAWSATAASARQEDTTNIMQRQLPLMAAADYIEATIIRESLPGFAGLTLDVPKGVVNLYWRGKPPVSLLAAIKDLHRPGVEIILLSAPHTREQLESTAAGLLQWASSHTEVSSVHVKEDGTGIEVGVRGSAISEIKAQLVDLSQDDANVPVTFRIDMPVTPYRNQDHEPVSAGAATQVGIGSYTCGSGFTAYKLEHDSLGNVVGIHGYTFAAAHCGGTVGDDVFAGNGPPIGRVESVVPGVDSIAIRTNRLGLPRMYDGGNADGSWFFKPVVALGTNRVGGFVCVSNVKSGTRCNLRITETSVCPPGFPEWGCWARAEEVNGAPASAAGDSGSPIFALDAQERVVAMGQLVGGLTRLPAAVCANASMASTICSVGIEFADQRRILDAHGLTLLTAGDWFAWPPSISLRSYDYRDSYIRHRNFLAQLTPILTDQDRRDASFWLLPGLAGDGLSLQSATLPGYYLRHENLRLMLSRIRDQQVFREDATFYRRRGLAYHAAESLESYNFPGYYIRHAFTRVIGEDPVEWVRYLWLDKDTGGRQYAEEATFYFVPALFEARPPVPATEMARSGRVSTLVPE